jgi:signal transduction histidine kinase
MDFRLLFEESPDVLLVLLPDAPRFTMVAATEARLRATHTTRETLGRGLFEVFPDNPDAPDASGTSALRASLERVLETRTPDTMAVQRYDIRGPDGTFQSKYWSPKNIPVLAANGDVTYLLHRVEDVTELVQASELGQELRDRSREMEREIIHRSRELSRANQSLRDANAKLGELDSAKTAFFSNVSHEFRTPLTLILGPLEVALAKQPPSLSQDDLVSCHGNALRLLRLVNSLLDFSRLEAGGLSLRFAPTDLATLSAGLASAYQSLLDEVGLRLVVDCPPLPEPVYVDQAQWEKMVLNLVSNAFKFTFAGEIAVRLSWHGDHVELSVRDTGTGIPEPALASLFQRFQRVEGARGRSFEGTGIGLSLVHELATRHGGSVRVESKLGEGSLFVISIPTGSAHLPPERVVDEAPLESRGDARRAQLLEAKRWLRQETTRASEALEGSSVVAQPGNGTRRKLLVADDNADMREYMARLLSPHWQVELAVDGQSALAAATAAPPDLVLSDVMMPGMDGVSLLAELRADPRTRTVPVILISARAGEEARLEGLATGADDYLIKPFAARELLTRVNTHLEMARVRREAYDELAKAQAQLVQSAKMASLGELVAGIAHEINNPLAFAVSHLSTVERSLNEVQTKLAQELAGGPAVAWRRALDRLNEIHIGLARIQELVAKLRTFSRLDEGERKLVSIRESVASVLMILGHRLQDGIQVTTTFGEPDSLECYAGLLNQAIMNLLVNAIDAITAPGSIQIVTGRDADAFEISISDSGCGIPEIHRSRVFDPFFTTKPVGEGTGLGLSIVHSIIQRHGGSLALLARAEGGTKAVVRLPLEPLP